MILPWWFYPLSVPLAAFSVWKILPEYLREKSLRELERGLPRALYRLASFPPHTPLPTMLRHSDHPVFLRLRSLLERGVEVPAAVEEVKQEYPSRDIRTVMDVILEVYRSGASFSRALKDLADDMASMQALRSDLSTSLLIQKYTVLLGLSLLVPVILGFSTSLILSFSEPVPEILAGNLLYLALTSASGGLYVGVAEGSIKKGLLLMTLMAVVSLTVYGLVAETDWIGVLL